MDPEERWRRVMALSVRGTPLEERDRHRRLRCGPDPIALSTVSPAESRVPKGVVLRPDDRGGRAAELLVARPRPYRRLRRTGQCPCRLPGRTESDVLPC